ncbi:hypothetical protein PTT_16534 [Pyrenophora teres f. teres 0-1]|uniref:Uncharacterized protein n=1 Tax=Pyrenophora teres f. teres (strain 0-1) TaxID=861557 RepID=E3S2J2_PYRTT|nr:hypothetical protein PTT_16534 [Pyrenophora teres f. teres 0-1]
MPKRRYGDKPYRLITELGECLILPAEQFVRMHSEKRLSFAAIIRVDFHGHLPGFGPYNLLMHKNMLAQTLIRKRLTKSLNGLVEPLSTETAFAVKTVFGETSGRLL